MPLAPRFDSTRWGDDGCAEPFDVAHGHRRRHEEGNLGADHVDVGDGPSDTRLGGLGVAGEHGVDGTLRLGLGAEPRRQPTSGRRMDRIHQFGAKRRGIGVYDPVGSPLGIGPPAVGVDHDLLGVGEAGQPLAQDLRCRGLAQPQHGLDLTGGKEAGRPQHTVERGDRIRTAADLGTGVGQHRPTERLGQVVEARASAAATGDDDAATTVQLGGELA